MPADALPQPWPTPPANTVPHRREYRDALGRPLRGSVSITGSARTVADGTVTLPAPVTVEVAAGVLEVNLPPDTYRVDASLRTAEGLRVTDVDTITLGAAR